MRQINEGNYKAVGETIQKQIGKQAMYMMGVKQLTYLDKEKGGLSVKFSGSRKANYMEIVLNWKDLYSVMFYRLRGLDLKVVSEYDDVYFDSLHTIIEEATGLYLSL